MWPNFLEKGKLNFTHEYYYSYVIAQNKLLNWEFFILTYVTNMKMCVQYTFPVSYSAVRILRGLQVTLSEFGHRTSKPIKRLMRTEPMFVIWSGNISAISCQFTCITGRPERPGGMLPTELGTSYKLTTLCGRFKL